jgi:hypothetical protein
MSPPRRGHGKRKREVADAQRAPRRWRDCDVKDGRGGAQGRSVWSSDRGRAGQYRSADLTIRPAAVMAARRWVESGGADAAGSAQFGERPRFASIGESRGDALIHGDRTGWAARRERHHAGRVRASHQALRRHDARGLERCDRRCRGEGRHWNHRRRGIRTIRAESGRRRWRWLLSWHGGRPRRRRHGGAVAHAGRRAAARPRR